MCSKIIAYSKNIEDYISAKLWLSKLGRSIICKI
jgi:hypothetical protein